MATYKVIDSTKLKSVNSGCFGEYRVFRNKKKGVKLFYSLAADTKKEAVANLKKAKKLYDKLVKASKLTALVPRPYGLVIVKNQKPSYPRSKYEVGYMMSHVKGKTLSGIDLSNKDEDRLNRIEERMYKLGLYMGDNHDGNIMKSGKRFIFIDADRFQFHEPGKKHSMSHSSW